MPRKDWLKSALVRLTSSDAAQHLLERHVEFVMQLMGIGSGGSPEWSGEKRLGLMLRARHATHRKPLCIFDVGANTGQFLRDVVVPLSLARIPLHAHAFEPAQATFDALRTAFRDRSDISLNNFGLGSESGESNLFYNIPGSGLASLSRRRLDHFGIQFNAFERVRVAALDEYCQEHGVERIDLLKLDVEGHELDVLRGGARLFHEGSIGMASFEFGGADIDSRTYFQDFWYFFREHGIVHRLTPSGRLLPIRSYREIYEQFRPTVFVFLQSST